jgi:hypothetical protein
MQRHTHRSTSKFCGTNGKRSLRRRAQRETEGVSHTGPAKS